MPEGWPGVDLDARSAQLILDLEVVRLVVRLQAWMAYGLQQIGQCELRQLHLKGSLKQQEQLLGSMISMSMSFDLLGLVCILACRCPVHFARGFRSLQVRTAIV